MVELSDMPREEIIQIKYGLTAGTKPSSLLRGEMAVNLADLLAFVGNDLGTAVPLLGKDYLLASTSYDTDTSGITVPELAEFVEIVGCGGGGGGGAGARSDAGSAMGGPGGHGGLGGRVFFPLDELGLTSGSVLKVLIGAGGIGGTGTFSSGTQTGRAGSNGSSTFLKSNDESITYMEFPGGEGGYATAVNAAPTTTDYWTTTRFGKLIQGDFGFIQAVNVIPPPLGNGTPSIYGGGGGAAGGWASASSTNFSDGCTGGGLNKSTIIINGGGGGTAGIGRGNVATSADATANGITGWGGGGGGSRNAPTVAGRNGGNGADGGPRGGGGGGGGALRGSRTDCRPGNGGTGGNGYITLRWWGLLGQTVYGRIPLR